jgi:hypothetical protein
MVLVNNAPAKIFYIYLDGFLMEGFRYPDNIFTFPTVFGEGYGNIGCYMRGLIPTVKKTTCTFSSMATWTVFALGRSCRTGTDRLSSYDPIPPFYYDDVNYTGDFKGSVVWMKKQILTLLRVPELMSGVPAISSSMFTIPFLAARIFDISSKLIASRLLPMEGPKLVSWFVKEMLKVIRLAMLATSPLRPACG